MKATLLIAPLVTGLLVGALPARAETAQHCADQWKIMPATDKAKTTYEAFWARCTKIPAQNAAIFPNRQSPPPHSALEALTTP